MLLRPGDRVVLTDLGIALPIGATGAMQGEGTLAYMPPEQRAGAPAHPSMDVHALGATLREIIGQLEAPAPARLVELAAACTAEESSARPGLDALAAALGGLR
jgi:serine/threonine-protein kinase